MTKMTGQERLAKAAERAAKKIAADAEMKFRFDLQRFLSKQFEGGFTVDKLEKDLGKVSLSRSMQSWSGFNPITFDDLVKLSSLFGTRMINLIAEDRAYGGCESCGGSETMQNVFISEITIWPEF